MNTKGRDLEDVRAMLGVAKSLCRQAADLLARNDDYGWAEDPYEWDTMIDEYLFIMDERKDL